VGASHVFKLRVHDLLLQFRTNSDLTHTVSLVNRIMTAEVRNAIDYDVFEVGFIVTGLGIEERL